MSCIEETEARQSANLRLLVMRVHDGRIFSRYYFRAPSNGRPRHAMAQRVTKSRPRSVSQSKAALQQVISRLISALQRCNTAIRRRLGSTTGISHSGEIPISTARPGRPDPLRAAGDARSKRAAARHAASAEALSQNPAAGRGATPSIVRTGAPDFRSA